MAVCIRLSRFGRLHRPYFRVVAIDKRCHREGVANEIVGSYDPQLPAKNLQLQMERIEAWVREGAQISDNLKNLMRHYGYQVPAFTGAPKAKASKPAAKAKTPAKGVKQPWAAPTRRALRKHQSKIKAKRKVETEAAATAAAAAKAAAEPAAAEPAKA